MRSEPHLPFKFIKIHHEPDGHFPNGIPNPMLEENRAPTVAAIRRHGADFGIAWDGDYDRCFFFDEHGAFIEGYYIVGLLASVLLRGSAGGKVVHDPRLTWNTLEMVQASGGVPVLSKSGHAFIKQRMREVDGVYGGEMSAHHYFKRFAYCDSGMIPWLIVAQILCESGQSLSSLVGERIGLLSGQRRTQLSGPRRQGDARSHRGALCTAGPCRRSHRRGVLRICGLALQSAQLEHRALDQAQCRGARLGETHAGEDRGIARPAENAGRRGGGRIGQAPCPSFPG